MKVLIVIDMQNDFIDGALGTKEAVTIVPRVKKKIDEYHAIGAPVFFTQDTHGDDYMQTQEGQRLPIPHCIMNTNGWQISSKLTRDIHDKIIRKGKFGYSNWGEFEEFSHAEIEIIGLCTDICVVSNALILKALFPEAQIKVDAKCCAGVTLESHEAALTTMESCQIDIIR